ncbi:MAG: MCE family protein [Candidatus Omnitrophica bacterium]|nr:MCE family protein [Candidatus Omnitrophota bacterium]
MDSIRTFEWKVGLFILAGAAILFFIVFSIGDISLGKQGYHITVTFDFASGIGPAAPVRLAGIGVGEVEGVSIYLDEKENKTKAKIYAWIKDPANIEEDAEITINTLGLLGEKYLEIIPGTPGKRLLKNGDTIAGRDPVLMEEVTRDLKKMADAVVVIVERLKKGEGTIGRLLVEDKLYDDLVTITGKVRSGEGTVGKLFMDDKIYKDLEEFVADLKKHPWKLLNKPRGY